MIIETEDNKFAVDDRGIVAVEYKSEEITNIYIYGISLPIRSGIKYDDALKIFKDGQSRDKFTDAVPRKSNQKKFDPIIVGAHKFKIDIRTTEYEDGASSVLQLYTNFELKSEDIKNVIKSVEGVDSSMTYLTDRYETSISIGKMFDAEWVRQNLENALIMYLQS